MGTKTKPDATSELHLIMGEVHASVKMVVPSNEVREIKMTPAIPRTDHRRTRPAMHLD
jgi:hypothetical protein